MFLFILIHERAPCMSHFPLREREQSEEGYCCKSHLIFDLSVQFLEHAILQFLLALF